MSKLDEASSQLCLLKLARSLQGADRKTFIDYMAKHGTDTLRT